MERYNLRIKQVKNKVALNKFIKDNPHYTIVATSNGKIIYKSTSVTFKQ